MNDQDQKDFTKAEQRIYELMKDEKWYPAQAIIQASGQREGLRRLRNLRSKYNVEMLRMPKSREFWYRLSHPTEQQLPLF